MAPSFSSTLSCSRWHRHRTCIQARYLCALLKSSLSFLEVQPHVLLKQPLQPHTSVHGGPFHLQALSMSPTISEKTTTKASNLPASTVLQRSYLLCGPEYASQTPPPGGDVGSSLPLGCLAPDGPRAGCFRSQLEYHHH